MAKAPHADTSEIKSLVKDLKEVIQEGMTSGVAKETAENLAHELEKGIKNTKSQNLDLDEKIKVKGGEKLAKETQNEIKKAIKEGALDEAFTVNTSKARAEITKLEGELLKFYKTAQQSGKEEGKQFALSGKDNIKGFIEGYSKLETYYSAIDEDIPPIIDKLGELADFIRLNSEEFTKWGVTASGQIKAYSKWLDNGRESAEDFLKSTRELYEALALGDKYDISAIALDNDYAIKGKTAATNQLKRLHEEYLQWGAAGGIDFTKSEREWSEAGLAAGYAYINALENAIKQGAAESRVKPYIDDIFLKGDELDTETLEAEKQAIKQLLEWYSELNKKAAGVDRNFSLTEDGGTIAEKIKEIVEQRHLLSAREKDPEFWGKDALESQREYIKSLENTLEEMISQAPSASEAIGYVTQKLSEQTGEVERNSEAKKENANIDVESDTAQEEKETESIAEQTEAVKENTKAKEENAKTGGKDKQKKGDEASLIKQEAKEYKELLEIQEEIAKLETKKGYHESEIKALRKNESTQQEIYERIKAQVDALGEIEQAEERALNIENLRVKSAEKIAKTQAEARDVIINSLEDNINDIAGRIDKNKYTNKWTQEYIDEITDLQKKLEELDDKAPTMDLSNLKSEWEKLEVVIDDTIGLKAFAKYKQASQIQLSKLEKQIAQIVEKNSKMGEKFKKQWDNLRLKLDTSQSVEAVQDVVAEMNHLQAEMADSKRTGMNFFDTFTKRLKSLNATLVARYLSLYDLIRYMRNAVSTIQELDTALIDLRKTTTMNTDELEQFYYDSTGVAKQMGVSTEEIISQAAAWSRLGYSSKEAATEMAALSSQFASISPGMSVEKATDGLVSTMKAFHIGVADVESEIMDSVNRIGNTMATTNEEVVEMLERSSAAMNAANNSLEETIALESAAVQITRNAETTGTAFRTISMRIRGYDEETEEYIGGVEELSGKIADLTKSAEHPMGVSLFKDEAKTEFKSTYQLLKDIADIYDELEDKTQAQLLEKLAGKRGGQVLAGILDDFSEVERAMGEIEKSAGSADAEMSIIQESIDYKLNNLKETWTETIKELVKRGDLGEAIDLLTKLSEAIGNVIENLGLLGTALAGGGLFVLVKNFGTIQKAFKSLAKIVKLDILVKAGAGNKALGEAIKGMSAQTAIATMAQNGLNEAQIRGALAASGMTGAEIKGAVAAQGAAASTNVFTAAVDGLAASLGITTGALLAIVGVLAAIGVAIYAGKKAWDEYNVTVEEVQEEIDKTKGKISELKDEIKELEGEERTSFQEERLKNLREELAIQEQILAFQEKQMLYEKNGTKGSDYLDKDSWEGKLVPYERQGRVAFDKDKRVRVKALQDFEEQSQTLEWYEKQLKDVQSRAIALSDELESGNLSEKERIEKESEINDLLEKQAYWEKNISELKTEISKTSSEAVTSYEDLLPAYNEQKEFLKTLAEDDPAYKVVKERLGRYENLLFQYKKVIDGTSDLLGIDARTDREKAADRIAEKTKNTGGTDKKLLRDYFNGLSDEEFAIATKLDVDYSKTASEIISQMDKALAEEGGVKLPVKTEPSDIATSVKNVAERLKPQFDELGELYQSIFYGSKSGGFTLENIDNDQMESLRKAFYGDLDKKLNVDWEELGIDWEDQTLAINRFLDTITSAEVKSKSLAEQQRIVQESVNEIATSYFYAAVNMQDFNEETEDAFRQQFKKMGIVNADEIVTQISQMQEIKNSLKDISEEDIEFDIRIQGAEEALEQEYEKIEDWGLGKYAQQIKDHTIQSVYGNVDMDKRTVIKYSEEIVDAFEEPLKSWEVEDETGKIVTYYDEVSKSVAEGLDHIDTVFGGGGMFQLDGQEVEIAFTPIMVDENGNNPQFLSKGTVENYIQKVLDEADKEVSADAKAGKLEWSQEEVYKRALEIDKNGRLADVYNSKGEKVGKEFVHGIIAGMSDFENGIDAEDIQLLMHFSGEEGAVQLAEEEIEAYNSLKEKIANGTLDFTNITAEEIEILEKEGAVAEGTAQRLALMALQEQLANGNDLDTNESVKALQELASTAGFAAAEVAALNDILKLFNMADNTANTAAAESIRNVANQKLLSFKTLVQEKYKEMMPDLDVSFPEKPDKKGGGGGSSKDPNVEAFEKAKGELDALREADEISEKEYLDRLKALIEKHYSDTEKYAKEYFEAIKEYYDRLTSYYESALSGITKIFDHKINKAQKAKDEAVKALEKEKEAALESYQARIDAIDKEIKTLEKAKKPLQDEIDAIQKANEERQRAIDLTKAQYELERAQMQKTRLVYKNNQLVYEQDVESIRNAQQDLADKEDEKKIADLEKQIEAYDKQIELLQEQKEAIQEEMEAIEKYYDNLIKKQNEYWDSIIDGLTKQKEKWEEILEIKEISQAYADVQAVMSDFGYSVEDVLSGVPGAFEALKEAYVDTLSAAHSKNNDFLDGLKYATDGATESFTKISDNAGQMKDALSEVASATQPLQTAAGNIKAVGDNAQTASTGVGNLKASTDGISSNLDSINGKSFDTLISSIGSIEKALESLRKVLQGEGEGGLSKAFDDISAISFTELERQFGNLLSTVSILKSKIGTIGDDTGAGLLSALKEIEKVDISKISQPMSDLVTALNNLNTTSLGGYTEGEGATGIIGQFSALKKAVQSVTGALGGEGGETENSGLSGTSKGGTGNEEATGTLISGIEAVKQSVVDNIGAGKESEEGTVIGSFNALGTKITEDAKQIGTSKSEADEESLIGSIRSLPQAVEDGMRGENGIIQAFEDLSSLIGECAARLQSLIGSLTNLKNSSLGGFGISGSLTSWQGNAHAQGTWGADKTGKTLVGELGAEMVVSGNKWRLVGEHGAEFANIKKNDIVFNHKQTEDLLKHGKINSHGKALANGTSITPLSHAANAEFDRIAKQLLLNSSDIRMDIGNIKRTAEDINNTVQNITNNNTNSSPVINVGDLNFTLTGVTSTEVMNQIGKELERTFDGLALNAYQRAMKH